MPAFTSTEDISLWIEGKPRDIAVVLAARGALRVIPVLASTFNLRENELNLEQRDTVLRTFRRAATAWAVAAYPGRAADLRIAAARAAARSEDITALSPEAAAAWACAAAGGSDIARFSSHSVTYAIDAASSDGTQARSDILNSYAADAEILDQGYSGVTLAFSSKLWLADPGWAFDGWAELEAALLGANEDWEVWTDWYEARLKAGPEDQVIEVARATIPDDVWNQGPKVVNAQIKGWYVERGIWRYATENAVESEPPQRPSAGDADGPVGIVYRLAGLSLEELAVVGLRVALRSVPLFRAGPSEFEAALLSAFRAVSLAWVAAKYGAEMHSKSASAYAEASGSRVLIARAAASATAASTANSLSPEFVRLVANGIDILRFAARSNVTRAAFDVALSQDLSDLRGAPDTSSVAELPLWPGEATPDWARRRWNTLTEGLNEVGHGWEVWIDWYQHRLVGGARSEGDEFAYVEVPDELWVDGAAAVNSWIERRIERGREPLQSNSSGQSVPNAVVGGRFDISVEPTIEIASTIPGQRPAAIEPVWRKGRLTLPSEPAKSNLRGRSFTAALKSLREELHALANDIAGEANIDRRFCSHVRQLADQIPHKSPRQAEVFRLGHASAVFAEYSKVVDDQWPDFLAVRYHAVALHFDRIMQQSPLWREFKRNAEQSALSPQQVSEAFSLGAEMASALRADGASDFVDPIISETLEQLAEPLRPPMAVGNEPAPKVIESEKELLAYDVVESVNNTLKRIAEEALRAGAPARAATRNEGSTIGKATEGYVRDVGQGFIRAAKRQGPKDGEALFWWLRRSVLAGITLAGSALGLPHLIAMYPQAFAWLGRLMNLLP